MRCVTIATRNSRNLSTILLAAQQVNESLLYLTFCTFFTIQISYAYSTVLFSLANNLLSFCTSDCEKIINLSNSICN